MTVRKMNNSCKGVSDMQMDLTECNTKSEFHKYFVSRVLDELEDGIYRENDILNISTVNEDLVSYFKTIKRNDYKDSFATYMYNKHVYDDNFYENNFIENLRNDLSVLLSNKQQEMVNELIEDNNCTDLEDYLGKYCGYNGFEVNLFEDKYHIDLRIATYEERNSDDSVISDTYVRDDFDDPEYVADCGLTYLIRQQGYEPCDLYDKEKVKNSTFLTSVNHALYDSMHGVIVTALCNVKGEDLPNIDDPQVDGVHYPVSKVYHYTYNDEIWDTKPVEIDKDGTTDRFTYKDNIYTKK